MLLLIFTTLVLLRATPSSSQPDCSAQTACETCYSASFLCHWCKEVDGGTCHNKFSQYGCQVGDACSADDCSDRSTCSSCSLGGCKWCASIHKCVSPYSWSCALPSNCAPNDECKRTEPEFVGFLNGLPDWVIYVLFAVYLSLIFISIVTFILAYRSFVGSASQDTTPLVVSDENNATDPRSSRLWFFRIIAAAWTLVLIILGIIFILLALFWPAPPEVSMCNAQLMWSDTLNMIINSVTSGKASVESELLITVYNPNRVSLALNSVSGNISYRGQIVGTLDLGSVDAQPGSAADGLGVITFNGFDRITEMYYDFNIKHQLFLEFDLFVNFNIAGLGGFEIGVPKSRLNVNNPPPQKYCKCLENLTDPSDGTQDISTSVEEM